MHRSTAQSRCRSHLGISAWLFHHITNGRCSTEVIPFRWFSPSIFHTSAYLVLKHPKHWLNSLRISFDVTKLCLSLSISSNWIWFVVNSLLSSMPSLFRLILLADVTRLLLNTERFPSTGVSCRLGSSPWHDWWARLNGSQFSSRSSTVSRSNSNRSSSRSHSISDPLEQNAITAGLVQLCTRIGQEVPGELIEYSYCKYDHEMIDLIFVCRFRLFSCSFIVHNKVKAKIRLVVIRWIVRPHIWQPIWTASIKSIEIARLFSLLKRSVVFRRTSP